jgi:putative phage-type endonuclease
MDMNYTIEHHDNENTWKRARLRGIGASESSAIVRLSSFCSPYGLYVRKREGRVEDDDDTGLAEMQNAGHRHEPTIAKWFVEQSDHDVTSVDDPGEYTIFRSIERPHIFATCDRLANAMVFDDRRRPVEIKCAWYESAKQWEERIPIAYQCQGQHQMYVTGADEMFFAVLLNGYKFRWYRMERHERFIKRLCDKLDEFWSRVERRDPPPIDGHKSSLHALFTQYPKDDGRIVELPDELAKAVQEDWDATQRIASDCCKRKDELKARIQQFMGTAKFAIMPDDSGFRWTRNGKSGRFERIEKVKVKEDGYAE